MEFTVLHVPAFFVPLYKFLFLGLPIAGSTKLFMTDLMYVLIDNVLQSTGSQCGMRIAFGTMQKPDVVGQTDVNIGMTSVTQ